MTDTFVDKQVLVTGGAGFIGSHLVERLVYEGAQVTVVDNLITGKKANLEHVKGQITFIEEDVVEWTRDLRNATFNYIFHLASPASPKGYMNHPVETYFINSMGTHYLSQLAINTNARLLFTSTSEVYGDPLEHPQKETYWGNVNPIGERACYDESKRFGEMVVMNAVRNNNLDGRIVRIFNTYGPRMDPQDGRVFPSFISQALIGQPITVNGNGLQTRSFCFVLDMVEFLVRMMLSEKTRGEVVNVGNPEEHTILEMAENIKALTQSTSDIRFTNLPSDDPVRRKPDITKAKELLSYEPQVGLDKGLLQTIQYFKEYL